MDTSLDVVSYDNRVIFPRTMTVIKRELMRRYVQRYTTPCTLGLPHPAFQRAGKSRNCVPGLVVRIGEGHSACNMAIPTDSIAP
jgi:hypothetical protein